MHHFSFDPVMELDSYIGRAYIEQMNWNTKLHVLQFKLCFDGQLVDYEMHLLLALVQICREKQIDFKNVDAELDPDLRKALDEWHKLYMDRKVEFNDKLWRELCPRFGNKMFAIWDLIGNR